MKRSKKLVVAVVLLIIIIAGVSAVYFLKQNREKPIAPKQETSVKEYHPGDKLPDPPKIETKSPVTNSKEPAKPPNTQTDPVPTKVETPR